MKHLFKWAFILFVCTNLSAQNVAINADGSKPNANAILDIKSSTKGLLIPRMTSEARLKIPNTQGLMVYDVNTNSFWYNTGQSWQNLAVPSETSVEGYWSLNGNAVLGGHFLGTTNNEPLNFRVNNVPSGLIHPTTENTFFGFRSGQMMPTGKNNTAFGAGTLFPTTTGFDNTAVGALAMRTNTTGWSNSAFGRLALGSNTTGNYNTAVGQSALGGNTTGNENVAVGMGASLGSNTGNNNTAVGTNSQFFRQGNENTSVGARSLAFYDGGNGNTAVGFGAHGSVTPDNHYNTVVGHTAGVSHTATHATALGQGARAEGANSTALGHGAIANAPNKIRLGNAAVTVIEGQVPFTFPSDGRFKFGVQEDVKGLDFILQLRPVTYNFDTKQFDMVIGQRASASDEAYEAATNIRRTGFIAQEVEQAAIKAGYDFSGVIKPKSASEHYSLSYDAFVVPLVKAMQEQQQVIDQQNKRIAALEREIAEIKKLLQKK